MKKVVLQHGAGHVPEVLFREGTHQRLPFLPPRTAEKPEELRKIPPGLLQEAFTAGELCGQLWMVPVLHPRPPDAGAREQNGHAPVLLILAQGRREGLQPLGGVNVKILPAAVANIGRGELQGL